MSHMLFGAPPPAGSAAWAVAMNRDARLAEREAAHRRRALGEAGGRIFAQMEGVGGPVQPPLPSARDNWPQAAPSAPPPPPQPPVDPWERQRQAHAAERAALEQHGGNNNNRGQQGYRGPPAVVEGDALDELARGRNVPPVAPRHFEPQQPEPPLPPPPMRGPVVPDALDEHVGPAVNPARAAKAQYAAELKAQMEDRARREAEARQASRDRAHALAAADNVRPGMDPAAAARAQAQQEYRAALESQIEAKKAGDGGGPADGGWVFGGREPGASRQRRLRAQEQAEAARHAAFIQAQQQQQPQQRGGRRDNDAAAWGGAPDPADPEADAKRAKAEQQRAYLAALDAQRAEKQALAAGDKDQGGWVFGNREPGASRQRRLADQARHQQPQQPYAPAPQQYGGRGGAEPWGAPPPQQRDMYPDAIPEPWQRQQQQPPAAYGAPPSLPSYVPGRASSPPLPVQHYEQPAEPAWPPRGRPAQGPGEGPVRQHRVLNDMHNGGPDMGAMDAAKARQEAYKRELEEQIRLRDARKAAEKQAEAAAEAKLMRDIENASPRRLGGGGEPFRDQYGNIVTNLKAIHDAAIRNPHAHGAHQVVISPRGYPNPSPYGGMPAEGFPGAPRGGPFGDYPQQPPVPMGFAPPMVPSGAPSDPSQRYADELRHQMEEKQRAKEEESRRLAAAEAAEEARLAREREQLRLAFEREEAVKALKAKEQQEAVDVAAAKKREKEEAAAREKALAAAEDARIAREQEELARKYEMEKIRERPLGVNRNAPQEQADEHVDIAAQKRQQREAAAARQRELDAAEDARVAREQAELQRQFEMEAARDRPLGAPAAAPMPPEEPVLKPSLKRGLFGNELDDQPSPVKQPPPPPQQSQQPLWSPQVPVPRTMAPAPQVFEQELSPPRHPEPVQMPANNEDDRFHQYSNGLWQPVPAPVTELARQDGGSDRRIRELEEQLRRQAEDHAFELALERAARKPVGPAVGAQSPTKIAAGVQAPFTPASPAAAGGLSGSFSFQMSPLEVSSSMRMIGTAKSLIGNSEFVQGPLSRPTTVDPDIEHRWIEFPGRNESRASIQSLPSNSWQQPITEPPPSKAPSMRIMPTLVEERAALKARDASTAQSQKSAEVRLDGNSRLLYREDTVSAGSGLGSPTGPVVVETETTMLPVSSRSSDSDSQDEGASAGGAAKKPPAAAPGSRGGTGMSKASAGSGGSRGRGAAAAPAAPVATGTGSRSGTPTAAQNGELERKPSNLKATTPKRPSLKVDTSLTSPKAAARDAVDVQVVARANQQRLEQLMILEAMTSTKPAGPATGIDALVSKFLNMEDPLPRPPGTASSMLQSDTKWLHN